MKRKFWIWVLVWGGLILPYGCSVKWTDAMQMGEVGLKEFHKTVQTEVKLGLIFVPVEIDGEIHRFLFDSGAPFSISQKLQDKMGREYPGKSIEFVRAVAEGNLVAIHTHQVWPGDDEYVTMY